MSRPWHCYYNRSRHRILIWDQPPDFHYEFEVLLLAPTSKEAVEQYLELLKMRDVSPDGIETVVSDVENARKLRLRKKVDAIRNQINKQEDAIHRIQLNECKHDGEFKPHGRRSPTTHTCQICDGEGYFKDNQFVAC